MRFIVDIDMEDVKDDIFDSEIWFFAFKKVIDSDSVGGKILWVLEIGRASVGKECVRRC